MKKTSLIIALLAALSSPAFAQTSGEKNPPPPKTAATAPSSETVKMRSELSAAKKDYKEKKKALDADCKAGKMTKADCDAKKKTLKADDKATRDAIAKKYPNASKAEHGGG